MTTHSPFGTPQQFIDLGHSRVPHYRVGRGPDVLFVHGWPLYSATFRGIVPRLADRFTCHLIDLPGTGASDWDARSKIGLSHHVQSVRRVIEKLGLGEFALVAHDSGAVVARLVAASDRRVRGLVIGNSEIPGYHPWQLRLLLQLNRIPYGALAFGAALKLRAIRHSSFAYGACFHDARYTEGEFRELFLAPMERSRKYFAGQAGILRDFDWKLIDSLAEAHTRISAPVKLIWGAQDPYFPLAELKPTLRQFTCGASLSLIDPGKLFAHEEFPEQFAHETRTFLEECWSARELIASA